MRPIVLTVGPLAVANAALYVASVTPTSGTALTLTGTRPDVPRRVLLTFGNEASGRTLALVGTDRDGATRSETLTVASGAGGTVASVLDYASVTSATPLGGGWTAAATLGTSQVASSPWARMDDYGFTGVPLGVDVTGTINYTVESSDDDPNAQAPLTTIAVQSMTWQPHPNLAAQTIKAHDGYTFAPRFIRITANSQTNPGSATLIVTQAGGKSG